MDDPIEIEVELVKWVASIEATALQGRAIGILMVRQNMSSTEAERMLQQLTEDLNGDVAAAVQAVLSSTH